MRDDHLTINPPKVEWYTILVLEQYRNDLGRLIIEVGIAMTALDLGKEGSESQIGIGKGKVIAEALLQLPEVGIHLASGVVTVEAGMQFLIGSLEDDEVCLQLRCGQHG